MENKRQQLLERRDAAMQKYIKAKRELADLQIQCEILQYDWMLLSTLYASYVHSFPPDPDTQPATAL